MKNIIIFDENGNNSTKIENILKTNEDYDVRTLNIEKISEAKKYNPSLIILNLEENKTKEITMVNKMAAPTLVLNCDYTSQIIIRGSSYDFLKNISVEREFLLKVCNLVRIKELIEKVKLVSTTDELTGLYNRKYLQDRLEAEMSRAKRHESKVSCLLLDIDYFKVVNDMYGYEWGDVLLKKIAEMLKSFIRKEDILTRYGDEEFVIILPDTNEDNAYIFAERFRREIEKMEFIPSGEEERHQITISGGISSYPFLKNVEETANTLIRYSEHALYNAKKRGKNKIVQFSQINIEY